MNRKTFFFVFAIAMGVTFELIVGYALYTLINKIVATNELDQILKLAIFFVLALAAALSPVYLLSIAVSRYLPAARRPTPRPGTPRNNTMSQEILGKIILTILSMIAGLILSFLVKRGFNSGQLSENYQYIGLTMSIALTIALTILTWLKK